MPVTESAVPGNSNLAQQSSTGVVSVFTAYTGTGIPGSAANPIVLPQFFVVDGFNGALMLEIVENNVAGGATVTPQGSFDKTNWYSLGFYLIVSAGTTQTTLTRSIGAQSITQNTRYVLQVLDAFPYLRVNVIANGSSASLTAKLYAVPA